MKKLPQVAVLVIGVTALVAAGMVLSYRAEAAAVPPYDPSRLAHVGDARQLIVVTGVSKTSTYAALRTYQLGTEGKWTARFAAMPARNGYHGWAWGGQRVQGSGTTPQGTYPITMAFGLKPNPGTKLAYRYADANDYWVGDNRDPKTYNLFQPLAASKRTWRINQSEKLSAYPVQYEYAVVIDYNRPAGSTVTWDKPHGEYVTSRPADVRRGSAIFLHVNGTGSTAGCVSLRRADLLNVLKWLDPALKPRIVMGPLAQIGQV
jgi:L,D-peptidoglycan transpeptidase YkuD (ErfK/YbiS/YcfS/YnhG family)